MNTIKTELKSFYFDISKEEDKKEYDALCKHFKALKIKCFETWGGGSHYLDFAKNGIKIELETKYLFADQWNTAPIDGVSDTGYRVHDFAMDACLPNKKIKRGHYLAINDKMLAVRNNTQSCGYCGKQTVVSDKPDVLSRFCNCCIDSEYLTKDKLNLLRLQPISCKNKRAKLNEEEESVLMPSYVNAQLHGSTVRGVARIKKEREDLLKERDSVIKNASKKYDGFLWLMDNGINTQNCIYYNHTRKFCFGWRGSISIDVKTALIEALLDFPFDYEIK